MNSLGLHCSWTEFLMKYCEISQTEYYGHGIKLYDCENSIDKCLICVERIIAFSVCDSHAYLLRKSMNV
jgi:hypothetical protein